MPKTKEDPKLTTLVIWASMGVISGIVVGLLMWALAVLYEWMPKVAGFTVLACGGLVLAVVFCAISHVSKITPEKP